MSLGLTKRQAKVYNFICAYMDENGHSPSHDDIEDGARILRSNVFAILVALEERGYIRRLPNRARAIEITGPRPKVTAQAPQVFTIKGKRFLGFKVARSA